MMKHSKKIMSMLTVMMMTMVSCISVSQFVYATIAVGGGTETTTATRVTAKVVSKNALSGKSSPVEGVTADLISVGGKGETLVKTLSSDPLGDIGTDLSAGSYKFRLSKVGFRSTEVPFSVIDGSPSLDLGSIEMVALGKLQGTVTTTINNTDGSKTTVKLANATVKVLQGGKEVASVQTDKAGAYLIEGLAEGSYDIEVSKVGMRRKTSSVTTKDGEVTTYDVDLLPQTGTIKATVERYTRSKDGTLVKRDLPIMDADVTITSSKDTTQTTIKKTDSESIATANEIAVGEYTIQASKAGFESILPSVISVVDNLITTPLLTLIELGTNIMNIVFNDSDGNGIQEKTESGLEGIGVDILDKKGTIVGTTTTDKNGSYSFDLEPGDYIVRVKSPTGYRFTTSEPQNITIAEGTLQGKTSKHGLKVAELPGGSSYYDVHVSILPSQSTPSTPIHSVATIQETIIDTAPIDQKVNDTSANDHLPDQVLSTHQDTSSSNAGGSSQKTLYELSSDENSLIHPASLPDTGAEA